MNNQEITEFTEKIRNKLPDESKGIIDDDLGILILDIAEMNNTIDEKQTRIEKLENTNKILTEANGNLLQQVPMSQNSSFENYNKNNKKEDIVFSLNEQFDSKGNFK